MDVAKPYEFIRLGAMDVAKPYEFIWFGAMDVTKPCAVYRVSEFIGFGAMDVTKPYEFERAWYPGTGHGETRAARGGHQRAKVCPETPRFARFHPQGT